MTLEAATPGKIKSGGDGVDIEFGFGCTPFGVCLVAQSSRGVCHLSFVSSMDDEAKKQDCNIMAQSQLAS